MLSDSLRKRIAALNRASPRHVAEGPEEQTSAPTTDLDPKPETFRVSVAPADARLTVSLEEVAGGVEVPSKVL